MSWIITPRQSVDPDAAIYMDRVESADGQALETAVRDAINAFVVGCKADGIWSAIKASCILAGARTLNGALVPLVGSAPTRFGTEAGWSYNRKTGLQGNGSNNYLDSSYASNASPANSLHLAAYKQSNISGQGVLIGNVHGGSSFIDFTSTAWRSWIRGFTKDYSAGNPSMNRSAAGFFGASLLPSQTPTEINPAITAPSGGFAGSFTAPTAVTTFKVFARSSSTTLIENYNTDRIAFYSIGEGLNLALLRDRVTTLINAFAAAIP